MAAVCDVCGKGPIFGKSVSHSHVRTNRRWNPNIQRVRALVNGAPKRLNVCTSCLKAGKVTRNICAHHLESFEHEAAAAQSVGGLCRTPCPSTGDDPSFVGEVVPPGVLLRGFSRQQDTRSVPQHPGR